ncbi:MAG: hypothetical protein ACRC92_24800 [Peptostreptococcaceae bacterium]
MGVEAILIAIGIAAAGYFIGEGISFGLVNFKSGKKNNEKTFKKAEPPHNQLIREENISTWLGIPIEDGKELLKQYPEIPHIEINGKVYFIKEGLNDWISNYNYKKD